MLVHHLLAQHHGQELVVGDVLHQGRHDVPGLLEDRLVVPVRVDLAELRRDPVVLPHEERVDHGQHSLLVHSRVSRQEAVHVLTLQLFSLIKTDQIFFRRSNIFTSLPDAG